jgi:hypothetical protein
MPNSTGPVTSRLSLAFLHPVAAFFNPVTPSPQPGQACALQVDSEGNLLVNVAIGGGGGGSNASVGPTGSSAPVSATEIGIIDGTGKLQGVSAANPLPITGSISATNPSVAAIGAAVPADATMIGGSDGVDLRAIATDSSGQVKVLVQNSPAVSVSNFPATQPVSGAVTANQGIANTLANAWPHEITDGTHGPAAVKAASTAAVAADSALVVAISPNNSVAVTGTFFQATQPVSGTVGLTAGQAVELLDSGGANKASISAGGALKVDGSAVTQPVSATSLPLPTGASTDASLTNVQVAGGGTVAPSKVQMVGGKTNDATPQYDILPEGPGGRSVIVEGISGGVKVPVDGSGVTQPVSGTVTANAGTGTFNIQANASFNLAQEGGVAITNTPTAIGTKGTGNVMSVNSDTTSIAGTAVAAASAGVQKVGIAGGAGTSLETTAGVLDHNLKNVGNSAVVAASAGVQKVGISGAAGATLDSTIGAATAPTNALATSAVYQSTVPTLTAGQAVAAQCDTTGSRYVSAEGRKQTYRAGASSLTIIANPIAPTFSLAGSASKTIRITRIRFSCTASTGTITNIILARFSALSGGTSAALGSTSKLDINNAAQTLVASTWSVAATTATSAGIFATERYEIVTAAVSVLPGVIEWKFGDVPGAQELVLRGISDFVGIIVGAVGTTPLADIWAEWTEE